MQTFEVDMESVWIIAAYVVIGSAAGLLAGLLGIGGGVIAVPCLLVIFRYLDISQAFVMHVAIGTSLAAMVFNTFSSAWAHHKKGAVLWKTVKRMLPGLLLGSILGALIADDLSSTVLQITFGVFLIALGAFLLSFRKIHDGGDPLPSFTILNFMSFGVAGLSNILGIGGGVFTAPLLMLFKVSDKKAIGTSAAVSVGITFIGALSYLSFGLNEMDVSGMVGFIYLPAFFVIGIVSFFTAPLGAKLVYKINPLRLRKIFASTVIVVGLSMVFG